MVCPLRAGEFDPRLIYDIGFFFLLVYHCAFDEELPARNILVMENLRDQGYKPLRPETCGLVFMRAAMTRSELRKNTYSD